MNAATPHRTKQEPGALAWLSAIVAWILFLTKGGIIALGATGAFFLIGALLSDKEQQLRAKKATLAPLLASLRNFTFCVAIGLLLVSIEELIFASIGMFDSSVLSYEETLGRFSEFLDAHLNLALLPFLVVFFLAFFLDLYIRTRTVKLFLRSQEWAKNIAVVLGVVTAFSCFAQGDLAGWHDDWLFYKRQPEVTKLVKEIAQKRHHKLRLDFVRKKIETMETDEKQRVAAVLTQIHSSYPQHEVALASRLGTSEGDVYVRYVTKSSRFDGLEYGRLPRDFTFKELNELREESNRLTKDVADTRENVIALAQAAFAGLISDKLHPVLESFIEAMSDGVVESVGDRIFPGLGRPLFSEAGGHISPKAGDLIFPEKSENFTAKLEEKDLRWSDLGDEPVKVAERLESAVYPPSPSNTILFPSTKSILPRPEDVFPGLRPTETEGKPGTWPGLERPPRIVEPPRIETKPRIEVSIK